MTKQKRERNSSRSIDKNWEKIFNDHNILDAIEAKGSFTISSKEINKYKEARLMTKFDYLTSLPDLFFDNKLSILPITRGTYTIGHFDAYQTIENTNKIFSNNRIELPFPAWIETIDPRVITSESSMLNAAFSSGMISDLFNDEEILQTISGRMSSNSFDFNIASRINNSTTNISVQNSQLEIDGGFETTNKLMLFEAKNNTTDSFLIRQLYYPYRLWNNKIDKPITPIFLQYKNGIYNFSIFKFNDVNDYNSLELISRKNYVIGAESTTLNDIISVLERTSYTEYEKTTIPFPQADSLEKIIDMMAAIFDSENNSLTLEELTLLNSYVYRQAHYYSRAGAYLDIIKINSDGSVSLTLIGVQLMNKPLKQKNLGFIEQIFKHKIFNKAMKKRIRHRGPLTTQQTFEIMKESLPQNIFADSTLERRARTVNAWIKRILNMVDDY